MVGGLSLKHVDLLASFVVWLLTLSVIGTFGFAPLLEQRVFKHAHVVEVSNLVAIVALVLACRATFSLRTLKFVVAAAPDALVVARKGVISACASDLFARPACVL